MSLLLLWGDDSAGPKGVFHVNELATGYRFRAIWTSDWATDRSSALEAAGYQRITWGLPYVATITGIEVHFRSEIDAFAVENYDIDVTTPWGSFNYTGAVWLADAEVRIEIDDALLEVQTNCDWAFSFTELRIYVSRNGGAEVLENTIAAQSQSGIGFDLREDICWQKTLPMEGEAIPICIGSGTLPDEDCAETYASQPTYHDETNCSILGGWQWWDDGAFADDPVSVQLPDQPETTCECPGAQPTCNEVDPFESYNLAVSGKFLSTLTKVDLGTTECDCGGIQNQILEYFDRIYTVDYNFAEIGGIPETSGIVNHRYAATIGCGLDTDSTDETIPETITYCEASTTVDRQLTTQHCCAILQFSICPVENPPCDPCSVEDTDVCCTGTYRLTEWPTLQGCGGTAGNVWHDMGASNRHIRGYIENSNLQIQRSSNTYPFIWFLEPDVLPDIDWSCGRIDKHSKSQLLVLIAETLGDVKVYESTDEGTLWSEILTLGTGTKPAVVIGRTGHRHYFWIDGTAIKGVIYDAAGNVLEAEFTAVASGVDDSGIAAEERVFNDGTNQARHQMVLTYISSGVVTEVVADDEKTFS